MMKKITLLLLAVLLLLGMTACGKSETKSIFDGYSLNMGRDEIHQRLGEPDATFDALGDYDDTYYEVTYFGMRGFFRFFYGSKDTPTLESMIWAIDSFKTLSEKENKINQIIELYDKLYGSHETGKPKPYSDAETAIYEWQDTFLNKITLELNQYAEFGQILLMLSKE